jgi:hypothetical protein
MDKLIDKYTTTDKRVSKTNPQYRSLRSVISKTEALLTEAKSKNKKVVEDKLKILKLKLLKTSSAI